MPIHSSALAGELIKALGLPARCKVITIRLAAGEPITIQCEHFPDEKPARDALAMISTFQLGPLLAPAETPGATPTTPAPAPGGATTEGSKP